MNELQRSVRLQDPSTRARSSSPPAGRKAAVYLLAILIASTMVVWFGFLGWGFIAILQGLLDYIKDFATHFA
jgi:hypothetical protein